MKCRVFCQPPEEIPSFSAECPFPAGQTARRSNNRGGQHEKSVCRRASFLLKARSRDLGEAAWPPLELTARVTLSTMELAYDK